MQQRARSSGNAVRIVITIVAVALVVIVIAVVGLVFAGVKTKGFGLFTIVKADFYPEVTRRITSDPAFTAELGTPIVVNGEGVYCSSISNENGTIRDSCSLPVSGPSGSGTVAATIVRMPGGPLTTGLLLQTAGGKSIEGQ